MPYRADIGFDSGTQKLNEVGTLGPVDQVRPYLLAVNSISRQVNANKAFENPQATYTLRNTNGMFDNEIYGGEDTTIELNAVTVFTGKIALTPSSYPEELVIKADTEKLGYNQIINSQIKASEFASCPEENLGEWGNIIGGSVTDEHWDTPTGQVVACRVAANKYLVAWHHCKSILGAYKTDGTDIVGSSSIDNNVDGYCYIDYTSSDDKIYVNMEGLETGGTLIENPAEILDAINTSFGAFTIDGVAAAATIYDDRLYTGAGILINNDKTWDTFLQEFANEWDCMTFPTADGNVGLKALDWGNESATATLKVIHVDDDRLKVHIDRTGIYDEVQRFYDYHYRLKTYRLKPVDVDADTDHDAQPTKKLYFRHHTDSTTCKDVAARWLFFRKNPLYWYKDVDIFETIARQQALDIGDVINVTVMGGENKHTQRLAWVFGLNYSAAGDTVTLKLLDISAINQGVMLILDEGDADVALMITQTSADCPVML